MALQIAGSIPTEVDHYCRHFVYCDWMGFSFRTVRPKAKMFIRKISYTLSYPDIHTNPVKSWEVNCFLNLIPSFFPNLSYWEKLPEILRAGI